MKQFWMAAIAIGLWANAAALWLKPAVAQSDQASVFLQSIDSNISTIDDNISALVKGGLKCRNSKICQ